MRTVSLSNPIVQEKVNSSFVPLKLQIDYGTEKFPIDWPALKKWRIAYFFMGGKKTKGITGCSVVSPDLKIELGNTGSAFVWEMFDSVAYDATKFATMLDNSIEFYERYQSIQDDTSIRRWKRRRLVSRLNRDVKKNNKAHGKFRLPPKGFTKENAIELFQLSGDLPKN